MVGGLSRRSRWLWLVLGMALLGLTLAQALSGNRPAVVNRASAYLLIANELPEANKVRYTRGSPPIDLGAAEGLARASFGQVPLPAARDMATWRRVDTGAEITQVVLVYDDPAQAARLDALAVALLPGTLGLQPADYALPGAEDVRLWQAPGYRAVSFRLDGVAMLVGTTETVDEAAVGALAQAALERLRVRASTTADT